jgi:hypothetical protein
MPPATLYKRVAGVEMRGTSIDANDKSPISEIATQHMALILKSTPNMLWSNFATRTFVGRISIEPPVVAHFLGAHCSFLAPRPQPPFNLKSICASFPPDGSGINLFPTFRTPLNQQALTRWVTKADSQAEF